jgi:hypothetical protein
MVEVVRQAGVGLNTGLAFIDHNQRVCGLQKEKGRLTPCEAHLFGMLFIVASDAINPMDWKTRRQSHNGYRNGCGGGEQIAHVILSVVMALRGVRSVKVQALS